MFDLATVVEAGKSILGALISGASKVQSFRDRNRSAELCRAMRAIYFTPTGMIAMMKRIGDGEQVSETEFNVALHGFADAQSQVDRALDLLEHDQLFRDLRITISNLSAIDMVRYRKINLRQSILENFPRYRRDFTVQQRMLAREISSGLVEVNGLLEQLDAKLNIAAFDR